MATAAVVEARHIKSDLPGSVNAVHDHVSDESSKRQFTDHRLSDKITNPMIQKHVRENGNAVEDLSDDKMPPKSIEKHELDTSHPSQPATYSDSHYEENMASPSYHNSAYEQHPVSSNARHEAPPMPTLDNRGHPRSPQYHPMSSNAKYEAPPMPVYSNARGVPASNTGLVELSH